MSQCVTTCQTGGWWAWLPNDLQSCRPAMALGGSRHLGRFEQLGLCMEGAAGRQRTLKLNMKDRTDTELITKSQRAAINNISSPSENDQWWQLVNRLCRWTSLVTSFCPVRLIGAPMSVL